MVSTIGFSTKSGILCFCCDCLVEGVLQIVSLSEKPKDIPCMACGSMVHCFYVVGSSGMDKASIYCQDCASSYHYVVPKIDDKNLV